MSPITIVANLVKTAKASSAAMRPLSVQFVPGPKDVICQRGKTAFLHNKHFRALIEGYSERYSNASSRLEKSLVVSEVVDAVRNGSTDGGFVRCIDGTYYEVGDAIAREKCGGAFRDQLHTQYKSSTPAKKRRLQKAQEATSVTSKEDPIKIVPQHVVSIPEPANKRRKMEVPTTAALPPLSPNSTQVLCAFGDILKKITTRKDELATTKLAEPLVLSAVDCLSMKPENALSRNVSTFPEFGDFDFDELDVFMLSNFSEFGGDVVDEFELRLSKIVDVEQ